MDRGHDGTQGTNYSPLGIIVQFPVRVTSLCESLVRCALPTRPQRRDACTCVHVRRVEQTTLEGAGETTPRLIFVGHQLAATEQQQEEKSPRVDGGKGSNQYFWESFPGSSFDKRAPRGEIDSRRERAGAGERRPAGAWQSCDRKDDWSSTSSKITMVPENRETSLIR